MRIRLSVLFYVFICCSLFTSTAYALTATWTSVTGNLWWAECTISADAVLSSVDVRADSGSWIPLTRRSWGSWTGAFRAQDGSIVTYRARSSNGESVESGRYHWPSGTPISRNPPTATPVPTSTPAPSPTPIPSATGSFSASLQNLSGNNWWLQTDVASERPIARLELSLSGGEWQSIAHASYGSWTRGGRIPTGTIVSFRAISTNSEVAVLGSDWWPSRTPVDSSHPPARKRVLFIGNSATLMNELPLLVQELGSGATPPVEIIPGDATLSGATLEDHVRSPSTLAMIRQGGWNYVVIQGYSTETITDLAGFLYNAQLLANEAGSVGAIPVFFATWARRADDSLYRQTGYPRTPAEWTARVHDAYTTAANNAGGLVAYVGDAWQRSLATNSTINLFNADGAHPSLEGSFLSGCVLYSVLLGTSAVGNTATPAGLNSSVLGALQRAAQ